MNLTDKDIEFLLCHLKRYIRDKEKVLQGSINEEERKHWDRFFRVKQTKEVLQKLQEVYGRA
jgi:monoamine oxidase